MTNEALRKMVLQYMQRHERNRSWVAGRWGVSKGFVTLFLNGQRGCSEARAEELVKALRPGKAA